MSPTKYIIFYTICIIYYPLYHNISHSLNIFSYYLNWAHCYQIIAQPIFHSSHIISHLFIMETSPLHPSLSPSKLVCPSITLYPSNLSGAAKLSPFSQRKSHWNSSGFAPRSPYLRYGTVPPWLTFTPTRPTIIVTPRSYSTCLR